MDFERKGPARWIAWGGALAGVAGIVLSQTVLSPKYEVLYSGGVTVEARGVVAEADPRVSALRHGAMNLLRVVGLFR